MTNKPAFAKAESGSVKCWFYLTDPERETYFSEQKINNPVLA